MTRFFKPDMRQRLWIALGLLAFSTILVGAISWYALDRADTRLEQLYRQTLLEVARSLRLSKQSSDIATSAPFLLNFRSQFLIEREGQSLLETLDQIAQDWPSTDDGRQLPVYSFETEIVVAVAEMKSAIVELVTLADDLNNDRDINQDVIGQLRALETLLQSKSTDILLPDKERRVWTLLQATANELTSAGHAENLLGVGERRRIYQTLEGSILTSEITDQQQFYLDRLSILAQGEQGLFENRRRELSHRLNAQNALFRIRLKASLINDLSGEFAANAEAFLSRERTETATLIGFAKIVIVILGAASVAVALVLALFVSEYVIGNIKAISEAMLRLAQGDRRPQLTRKPKSDDEIGKLLHSFRIFRANALRLDRSNRQLTQKNALFERVFSNISDGVVITGEDGRLTAVNANFAEILGLDKENRPIGQTIQDVLASSVFAEDKKTRMLAKAFNGFAELVGTNGAVLEVRRSPLPDGGGVWLFSDTTERHRIEESMKQIQHIEGLGKVSGEVAHDFGNVLSSIATNIHLFETARNARDSQRFLERIQNAVEIGTSLVQRLLAFAKKQALSPEVVDINSLVTGVADLISIGLKKEVELTTNVLNSPLLVRVDPGQLESAILNLCLNSNQAIQGKGHISVCVKKSGADTAIIEVSDTGRGMEEQILTRAFEPFFSARTDGEGTGLGLPMVYGFMKQSGGDINIASKPGKGTQIGLSFPVAVAVEGRVEAGLSRNKALVVEDDAKASRLARTCLEHFGYSVCEISSFERAKTALASQERFELLLTDLHLDNGKSGWALAELSIKQRPQTRVIVVSGKLPRKRPVLGNRNHRIACIEKPLTRQKLARAFERKSEALTSLV